MVGSDRLRSGFTASWGLFDGYRLRTDLRYASATAKVVSQPEA